MLISARLIHRPECMVVRHSERTDLKSRQNVEVLLHVSPQHLLNDCSPQCAMVCTCHSLHATHTLENSLMIACSAAIVMSSLMSCGIVQ